MCGGVLMDGWPFMASAEGDLYSIQSTLLEWPHAIAGYGGACL